MPRDSLTGSRIRERRAVAGLRQAELAREVGISASYLNLIEHNRRRIGGKLLLRIAHALAVEPSMLTEGAEAALIAALREAAATAGAALAETDRADEFAGRFPGWAAVLAAEHRRAESLERTVETLSDRLTHDPSLAASLHEVLSTAAAIRSTASILAETGELEDEWRDRFHRNLNQDSRRLAESSKALVGYLDDSAGRQDRRGDPLEEVEAFVAAHDHHFAALEPEAGESVRDVLARADQLSAPAARQIAAELLEQYSADARRIPLAALREALDELGPDAPALARRFNCELPVMFRRLAMLPPGLLDIEIGLVVCDAAGGLVQRRPIEGFALPRHGASCPLWPLFTALSRPLVPVRRRVVRLGRGRSTFDCLAIAWPEQSGSFEIDPVYRSAMLIVPVRGSSPETETALEIGGTCRLCPRASCPARREPSILGAAY